MAIALVLVLVVVGSVLFHALSPWWWTPIASNWDYIDHTLSSLSGSPASFSPPSCCSWPIASCDSGTRKGKGPLRAGKQAARIVADRRDRSRRGRHAGSRPVCLAPVRHRPDDATEVEVIAQQWQWSYRLPGADGKLGTSDSRLVSPENPLGINPEDPNGQDDVVVEAADLHLPIGKPVKMLLRSIDVLHDFYVPEFRAKMDMIPGSVTYFWFTPTRTGTFEVLCAELCGIGARLHARHRHGRHGGRLPGLAAGAVDLCAAVGARAGGRGRARSSHDREDGGIADICV